MKKLEKLKKLKKLKRASFLLLLAGVGIIYMFFADGWQIYAGTLEKWNGQLGTLAWSWNPSGDFPGGSEDGDGIVVTRGEDDGGSVGKGSQGGSPGKEPDSSGGEPGSSKGEADGSGRDGASEDGGTQGSEGDAQESDTPEGNAQDGDTPEGDAQEGNGLFGDGSDPTYETVGEDYFADAVFIGDSRIVGLLDYGGLEDVATFYASKGLTIYKLFDSEIVDVPGKRGKITIEEALKNQEFHKIYLMIGINEMGTGTVETFTQAYREAVDHLLELQPNAILYIQSILKVTKERSDQGDYINNEGIDARNAALSGFADNKRIFWLDENPVVCDETGGMNPSYTFDGVHLLGQYNSLLVDYLKSHALDFTQ